MSSVIYIVLVLLAIFLGMKIARGLITGLVLLFGVGLFARRAKKVAPMKATVHENFRSNANATNA